MSANTSGRQGQIGASVIVALLAAAALFVAINYLGARHFRRWDWTSEQIYTLSGKTEQVLAEADTNGTPIRVTALLSDRFELFESVRELLANYDAASDVLTVEFLDPAMEPGRAEALYAKFGLVYESQLRFVFFETGDRSKQVDLTEFVDYDYSAQMTTGQPRVQTFKGEEAFTGAILSVIQDQQSAICFSTGHGELDHSAAGERSVAQIAGILEAENYQIEEWDSLAQADVPATCHVLVIAGPERTLLESEADAIGRYLDGGGGLLALLEPRISRLEEIRPTGLEGLMERFGILLGSDMVVDRGDPSIILLGGGAETLVVRDMPSHPVTKNLEGSAALFRIARSVTPVESPPAGITVETIARTSPDGWGEKNIASLATGIELDDEDLPGPVAVGVAVGVALELIETAEPGDVDDPAGADAPGDPGQPDATAGPESGAENGRAARLVVFGDADFASDAWAGRLGNLDLALNAIHWLAEQEALIGIEPRTPEQVLLTLTPSESRNMTLLVLIGLPGFVAAAGLGVWWRRRS